MYIVPKYQYLKQKLRKGKLLLKNHLSWLIMLA